MNKIVVLIGKNNSGKDTLYKKIIDNFDILEVISNTTRGRRNNETNGVEYNFVTKSEFEKSIQDNELIEFRTYDVFENDEKTVWYYGTHKDSIDLHKGNNLHIVDIKGLMALQNCFGRKNILSIYIDASLEDRIERTLKRKGTDLKEKIRRMVLDESDFQYAKVFADYTVENKDLNRCYNQIVNILEMNGIKKKDN